MPPKGIEATHTSGGRTATPDPFLHGSEGLSPETTSTKEENVWLRQGRARAQKLGAGGRRGERCAAAARARWRLPPSQRAFLARCCDVWSQPPRAVMRRARDSFLVYVRKTFVVVMVEVSFS